VLFLTKCDDGYRTDLPFGFEPVDIFDNTPRSQFACSFDFQQFFDSQREAIHRQEFLPIDSDKHLADAHVQRIYFADESLKLGLGLCALGHSDSALTVMVDLVPLAVNRGLAGLPRRN